MRRQRRRAHADHTGGQPPPSPAQLHPPAPAWPWALAAPWGKRQKQHDLRREGSLHGTRRGWDKQVPCGHEFTKLWPRLQL